jgi:hypothetical protein
MLVGLAALARELLHRPGKPAGVKPSLKSSSDSR